MTIPEQSTLPAIIEPEYHDNGVVVADVDVSHIITEDDTPVDNLPSEKHQRLLTHTLYSSWRGPGAGMPFLAAANVGVFYSPHEPPLVPDVFVSVGVREAEDWWDPRNRSYFIWEFGKPPDVVIEIVSNRRGGEAGTKLATYAQIGIPYYVIYDPHHQLKSDVVRVYHLHGDVYVPVKNTWMPGIELGLTLWRGVFEFREDTWLRWQDGEGRLLLTGTEREEQEKRRADQQAARAELEAARADEEQERAEREARWAKQEAARATEQQERAEREARRAAEQQERAEQLAARLRSLGIDPDDT